MAKRAKSTSKASTNSIRISDRQAFTSLPEGYGKFAEDIKARIRNTQVKAALSVNRELISLYWDIGKSIVQRQKNNGWGKSVVEQLSHDIRSEFPQVKGFSPQNMWYMRAFYLAWTEEILNLQQPVGDLDEEMRHPDDQPSIGLILCKEKNRIVVEYALKSSSRPVGVAEYKLTRTLPKNLKAELPTPKQIRDGLKEKAATERKKTGGE